MRIFVIGATGQFGKRLCQRLVKVEDIVLFLNGRNALKLDVLQQELIRQNPNAQIQTIACDVQAPQFEQQLQAHKPSLVVHLGGPFQGQDYEVAKRCLHLGINYIDLADGRAFVTQFSTLDPEAKVKNVALITGASTVPGLSSAVLREGLKSLAELHELDYGISSGLKTGLGMATLQAVMSYCGKAYSVLEDGKLTTIYGLGRARHHDFPEPAGRRSIVDCDIPDHDLFPKLYPTLKTIRFGACMDVPGLASFLSVLSHAVRKKWIKNADFLTRFIKPFADLLKPIGDYNSGFFMHLKGLDAEGRAKHMLLEIIARDGCGLEIPITPVIILIKRMSKGEVFSSGAYACQNLIQLSEFQDELAPYPMSWHWQELAS